MLVQSVPMFTKIIAIFLVLSGVFVSMYLGMAGDSQSPTPPPLSGQIEVVTKWTGDATERYVGQIDRVSVLFEHLDYTQYRLQTNSRVRTGLLNTERGYKDDIDATVYVLDWQKPEGAQLRYVRLTAEPTTLYLLSSDSEIIMGSKLTLESEI